MGERGLENYSRGYLIWFRSTIIQSFQSLFNLELLYLECSIDFLHFGHEEPNYPPGIYIS